MDYSPQASSVHEISQVILECVAISFFRGPSQLRDRIRVSSISKAEDILGEYTFSLWLNETQDTSNGIKKDNAGY